MRRLGRVLVLTSALLLSLGVPFWDGLAIAQTPGPDQIGEWSDPFDFGVQGDRMAAIHMTVLPNGKVLAWNGPGANLDDEDAGAWRDYTPAVLWDPVASSFTEVRLDLDPNPADSEDLFCSGHALLADGRLLVAGGHAGKKTGIKKAVLFDYTANTWAPATDMGAARWYPTNTALDTGRMLVASGLVTGGDRNRTPEVYIPDPGGGPGTWQILPLGRRQSLYPFMYVAPTGEEGRVFDAGDFDDSSYLNTTTGVWTFVASSGRAWTQGSSVMYEPGKILNIGGGATDPPGGNASKIDLNAPTPAWSSVGTLHHPRRNHNATILADGTVLVTGGATCDPTFSPSSCDLTLPGTYVYIPERWDPMSPNTWVDMANMKVPIKRGYHSTAVLLPDGRVVTAGGTKTSPETQNPKTAEFYSPPHLFKGARPTIGSAPTSVGYGETFPVTYAPAADTITKVTWIRLSSVTHGFNQNQRFNALTFSPTAGGVLFVNAPANAKISPPGHYMLFLFNSTGAVSIARIIKIQ